jgi:hypothetical protein
VVAASAKGSTISSISLPQQQIRARSRRLRPPTYYDQWEILPPIILHFLFACGVVMSHSIM